MTFDESALALARLESAYHAAAAPMQRFARGPMGLPAESVRVSPEYQAARAAIAKAAADLRNATGVHLARFKAEERGRPRRIRIDGAPVLWSDFLAENADALTASEVGRIRAALAAGESYVIGGGTAASFTLSHI